MEESHKIDKRLYRPLLVKAKKQNQEIVLTLTDDFNIDDSNISFNTPNVITLSINISHKEYFLALKIFNELIKPRILKNENIVFDDNELKLLFDYFEHIQISIIFAYSAIEAFSNLSIPDSYTYEFINKKKAKEIWGKDSIERWMITSDKLTKILPDILKVKPPQDKSFWNNFKELETLRQEIIHPKMQIPQPGLHIKYLEKFFKDEVFEWIKSTKKVIEYFCQTDRVLLHFPFGFGKDGFAVIEINDFDEYFEETS